MPAYHCDLSAQIRFFWNGNYHFKAISHSQVHMGIIMSSKTSSVMKWYERVLRQSLAKIVPIQKKNSLISKSQNTSKTEWSC